MTDLHKLLYETKSSIYSEIQKIVSDADDKRGSMVEVIRGLSQILQNHEKTLTGVINDLQMPKHYYHYPLMTEELFHPPHSSNTELEYTVENMLRKNIGH